MFWYISGSLAHKAKDFAVVDCGGVGYKIYTSVQSISNIQIGENVKFYTYMHVREDILAIYGFITHEELDMFELLISVSGIGPKAALSVISSISPAKFAISLVTDDVKTLTKISGIGQKTAQRIILELKDKIKSEQLTGYKVETVQNTNSNSEAINALIVLGYSQNEAAKAVESIDGSYEIEEIVRLALKKLSKF